MDGSWIFSHPLKTQSFTTACSLISYILVPSTIILLYRVVSLAKLPRLVSTMPMWRKIQLKKQCYCTLALYKGLGGRSSLRLTLYASSFGIWRRLVSLFPKQETGFR